MFRQVPRRPVLIAAGVFLVAGANDMGETIDLTVVCRPRQGVVGALGAAPAKPVT